MKVVKFFGSIFLFEGIILVVWVVYFLHFAEIDKSYLNRKHEATIVN